MVPLIPDAMVPSAAAFACFATPKASRITAAGKKTEAGLLTISPQMVIAAVVDLMIEDRTARAAHGEDRVRKLEVGYAS